MFKTPDGFQAWKDSPRTQEFLRFLLDRQADLCLAWGKGQQLSPEHQAQAVLLGQLAAISWDDVAQQYGIEMSDG